MASVTFPTTDGSTHASSGTQASSGSPFPSSTQPSSSSSSARQPAFVDRVAETAHHVVDDLASKAGPAAERVRSTVNSTMESVHRGMDGLSSAPPEWTESFRQSVREHPLAMTGAAVAVGFLLARLTRNS
jgi:ElaB/YqjD/DUF883 family membrane-anchored ribosome-binding protein